jgi:hypothetical protein
LFFGPGKRGKFDRLYYRTTNTMNG